MSPVSDDLVIEEVTAAFVRYEAALMANDVAVMQELFWDDPRVVRFGIKDAQFGADELAAWRAAQPPLPPGRTLERTAVTPLGADTAAVTTLFRYPGRAAVGRQTQLWVRLPEGWRIASAHVSEIPSRPPQL